jgi:hypothetical protein
MSAGGHQVGLYRRHKVQAAAAAEINQCGQSWPADLAKEAVELMEEMEPDAKL